MYDPWTWTIGEGGNVGGRGWAGWSGVGGGEWDNCNSIINKYILKKEFCKIHFSMLPKLRFCLWNILQLSFSGFACLSTLYLLSLPRKHNQLYQPILWLKSFVSSLYWETPATHICLWDLSKWTFCCHFQFTHTRIESIFASELAPTWTSAFSPMSSLFY